MPQARIAEGFCSNTAFSKAHGQQLLDNGYTVVVGFFDPVALQILLSEMKDLQARDQEDTAAAEKTNKRANLFWKPNVTHFQDGNGNIVSFTKEGVSEVDLHSLFGADSRHAENEARYPMCHDLFDSVEVAGLIESIMLDVSGDSKHAMASESTSLSSSSTAPKGDGEEKGSPWLVDKGRGRYAIKLQHNSGGAFPCHIDNPNSATNKRRITVVCYLNENWKDGDGGEVVFFPWMEEPVVVPPVFNRAVVFLSEVVLHSVNPAKAPRYCFSVWIDRAQSETVQPVSGGSQTSSGPQVPRQGGSLLDRRWRPAAAAAAPAAVAWSYHPVEQRLWSRLILEPVYLATLKDCFMPSASSSQSSQAQKVAYDALRQMHEDHLAKLRDLLAAATDDSTAEGIERVAARTSKKTQKWLKGHGTKM